VATVVVLAVAGRVGNALYERILISHYFFGGVLFLGVLIGVRVGAAGRDPHGQRSADNVSRPMVVGG
jgi:hypothetical protein